MALGAPSGFCAQQLTTSNRFTIAACIRFRATDLPLRMTASTIGPFSRVLLAELYNADTAIRRVRGWRFLWISRRLLAVDGQTASNPPPGQDSAFETGLSECGRNRYCALRRPDHPSINPHIFFLFREF